MGKFKDLFVKSDEPQQNTAAPTAPTEQQVNIPPRAFTMTGDYSPTEQPQTSAKPSPEIVAKIWDTLLAKNFPGPDYLELKGHTTALEAYMPDYTQRLLAAFSLLKNQYNNFSVKVVTDSIDGYINIVKEEKKEGEDECMKVYGEKLKEKQNALDSVTAEITNLQNEIREKNELLAKIQQDKGTLQQEVIQAQQEMDNQTRVFADSIDAVMNVLESDKRIISTLKV